MAAVNGLDSVTYHFDCCDERAGFRPTASCAAGGGAGKALRSDIVEEEQVPVRVCKAQRPGGG
jgi:hypothetical protein